MRRFLLIAAAIGPLLPAGSADARTRHAPAGDSYDAMVRRYYNDPYYGYQNGRVCARWCINDRNPCDPPSLKEADGRCFEGP